MADFTESRRTGQGLDPRKRVAYPTGMVLGADDFEQEQFHLRARDDLGVRALHGYGTVSGLAVGWNDDTGQLEVTAGLAVDPVGRFVCVPAVQCADLTEWLTAHRDELDLSESPPGGSPPDAVSLYVALCYTECETDTVPVPSETCRSGDESMAASRIRESFELKLLLARPAPAGEMAGGALGAAVDRILAVLESTPTDSVVDVDVVRRELLAWATSDRPELDDRPCLDAPADNCAGDATRSTAVLLARVDVDLEQGDDGRLRPAVPPAVVDDDRPVLVSTRFLQEWLTELLLHPDLLGVDDHNRLDNLATGDVHTQYLPTDGSRPLTGDLDADGHRLTGLAASAAADHAMRTDEIVGGDLEGSGGGARIARLQGTTVNASGADAPSSGDVLRFDGSAWAPGAAPRTGPEVGAVLPFVTIELMGRANQDATAVFLLWFNLDAPDNEVVLGELAYDEQFLIRAELCRDNEPGLRDLPPPLVDVERVQCNVFRVDVHLREAELRGSFLRFVFRLPTLSLTNGQGLDEYTSDRGITWTGQDGRETVTKFVVTPSLRAPVPGFEEMEALPPPAGGGRIAIERG